MSILLDTINAASWKMLQVRQHATELRICVHGVQRKFCELVQSCAKYLDEELKIFCDFYFY